MLAPLLVSLGDPERLAAALASGADALVFDLGSPDVPDRAGRSHAAVEALARTSGVVRRVVRLPPLSSGLVDGDLDTVMAEAPDAVLLTGAVGAADVQHLGAKLAVREAEHGLAAGRTGIVAAAADTGRGVLALPTLPGAGPRLRALAWDPEALARDLCAAGTEATPCAVALTLLIAAAAAAGVPALDAGEGRDDVEAFARACGRARRAGFRGKMATDPGQIRTILARFGSRR